MSDKQSNLTDKEKEDLQGIVTDTLASVCAMADKHSIDRDSMLKYFVDMLTAFTEVASIQNYETNHACNCKHNSNSRDRMKNWQNTLTMCLNIVQTVLCAVMTVTVAMVQKIIEWLKSEAEY